MIRSSVVFCLVLLLNACTSYISRDSEVALFTDHDLRSLLTTGAGDEVGLVYVWSPHMPYSITGLREMIVLARDLDLRLTPLLDPDADMYIAQVEAARAGLPGAVLHRLQSKALIKAGATMHYPTLVLYRGGHLSDRILPGYTTPPLYADFIRERWR